MKKICYFLIIVSIFTPIFALAATHQTWYEQENSASAWTAKWYWKSGERPGPVHYYGVQRDPRGTERTMNLTVYFWSDGSVNKVFIHRVDITPDQDEYLYEGTFKNSIDVKGYFYAQPYSTDFENNNWSARIGE